MSKPNTHPSSGEAPGGLWLARLRRVNNAVSYGAAALGAMACLALTAIVGYSVFMRYIVNKPQTWTDEMAGFLMVFIVMFGLAEALRKGDHIRVDLIMQFLSPKGQRWVEIWGLICMVMVSVAILISSWEMVAFSYSVDLISEGYVEAPMWIPQSTVPFGMGLMLLAAMTRLIDVWLTPASSDIEG